MRLRNTSLSSIAHRKNSIANVFSNAISAYSLRIPAGSSYNGSLIRVRRSSDNAELDFGAVANQDTNGNRFLDTTALLAWLTTNSGFVTTWYDQSGNGRHATQTNTTLQPRIVNAGVVDTYSGSSLPCLRATANGQCLNISSLVGASQTYGTISVIWAETATRDRSTPLYINPPLIHGALISSLSAFDTGLSNAVYTNGVHYSNGAAFTFAAPGTVGDKPTSATIFTLNPTTPITQTADSAGLMGDARAGLPARWVEAEWEVLLFPSVLTNAARVSLERSQGTAYGITVI